jgi:hypothetical protein
MGMLLLFAELLNLMHGAGGVNEVPGPMYFIHIPKTVRE